VIASRRNQCRGGKADDEISTIRKLIAM